MSVDRNSGNKGQTEMKTAIYKCEACNNQYRQNLDGTPATVERNCWQCVTITTFKRVRGTTKDSEHKIFMPIHNARLVVDEDTSECDMRSAEPLFFSDHFGERTTFTAYRGFIIMRYTAHYSDGYKERRTVVYAFGKWPRERLASLHITSACRSIASAKRLIDLILTVNQWTRDEEDAITR